MRDHVRRLTRHARPLAGPLAAAVLLGGPAVALAGPAMPDAVPALGTSAPPAASAAAGTMAPSPAGAGWVVASAYSAGETTAAQGCPSAPLLRDSHLSVATSLVPCGHRIRICTRQGRCVVAVRRDSGPFRAGRAIDLNLGVVRALGVSGVGAWGLRRVWWAPLGAAPARTSV